MEKDKDIAEDHNEATNDESTQPNEKDSKDLTKGEKTEEGKDITDDINCKEGTKENDEPKQEDRRT